MNYGNINCCKNGDMYWFFPRKMPRVLIMYHESSSYILTGYNQRVTGCGSQRRHVVVTQRKLV